MKIYHNQFVEQHYFPHQKLLKSSWLPSEAELDCNVYKAQMKKLGDILQDIHPTYLLSDVRNLNCTINNEIEAWTMEELMPVFISSGLKKLAILLKNEQAETAESIIHHNLLAGFKLDQRYFEDPNEAKAWLLST